jgi:hypothetical protein
MPHSAAGLRSAPEGAWDMDERWELAYQDWGRRALPLAARR